MANRKDAPKTIVPGFEMPKFDAPTFDVSRVEMPAAMREYAEKSVSQAKQVYDRVKAVAEQTTDMIEDSYATYSKGVGELAGKALDAAKANTVAALDHARDLMQCKSVAEFVEKQTAFVRAQFEAFTVQGKDMQSAAQRVAADAGAPMKAAAEKAAAEVKAAA